MEHEDDNGQRSEGPTEAACRISTPTQVPLQSSTHTFETSSTLQKECDFDSTLLWDVMYNLIKNPNITSSHLFRADIFWDSEKDTTFRPDALSSDEDLSGFVKHMKAECRPWKMQLEGFTLARTIVRQLVPRNAQLDKPLLQTCHFFASNDGLTTSVVLLPHAEIERDVPWYHPALRALAFVYTTLMSRDCPSRKAACLFAIQTCPFEPRPSSESANRTTRTLQNLLRTIHKHSTSRITGYIKKVHHDRIVPQKALQDTYARLKATHARNLIASWKEETDLTKGVFEDLGIAAFLIELWNEMYDCSAIPAARETRPRAGVAYSEHPEKEAFPGFVDIGCGNGLLVYILIEEGYPGYGFDARSRKTWDAFPDRVRTKLQEKTLISSILAQSENPILRGEIHDGILNPATFIVSNHADELTPWTPLLAYLNNSPFISIPCCSHDLSGSRFRFAPSYYREFEETDAAVAIERMTLNENRNGPNDTAAESQSTQTLISTEPSNGSRPPSSYATLCGYVAHLATKLGYLPEKEILRIPSTRNICILGRQMHTRESCSEGADRQGRVIALIEEEMRLPLSCVGQTYVERAMGVYNSKGRNH